MSKTEPRKRRAETPQAHPKGGLVTVGEAWKDEVRRVMKAKGWDQKDLAGKIPASTGWVTALFKPGDRQIRAVYKARIDELCGLLNSKQHDHFLRVAQAKWPTLSLKDVEHVVGLIESLANKP
jgi:hypothetical protein